MPRELTLESKSAHRQHINHSLESTHLTQGNSMRLLLISAMAMRTQTACVNVLLASNVRGLSDSEREFMGLRASRCSMLIYYTILLLGKPINF